MMFRVYRALLLLSAPLLALLIRVRALRGLEENKHLGERRGVTAFTRPAGKLVWVHAASVGEMLSILPLLRHLVEKNPGLTCLVTTVTVTAARLARRHVHENIIHQYAPFDHPGWVDRFLEHWKPDAAVWVESEIWPNMLQGVHRRGVPLMMVNGRLSERSAKRWSLVRGMIAQLLALFDICLAQSREDGERLKALGAPRVAIAGNMKYSSAPLPYDAAAYEVLKAQIGDRPTILFASTHAPEEMIAARVVHALSAKYKGLLGIVIPRHPARGEAITAQFEKADVHFAMRSRKQPIKPETEIYLADTMGEPGLFFRLCSIVFMGNSLTRSPGGGHNPIEPAHLDCAIVYGSSMWNFTEIDRELRAAHGAISVHAEGDLQRALDRLLGDPGAVAALADAARQFAQAQNSVMDRVVAHLRPHLERAGIQA